MTDPQGRDAILDLLGVLAYGELSAFDRMAADARLAPNLGLRASLAEIAALEINHYAALAQRIRELDGDPVVAMAPFVSAVDTFHQRTEPSTWGEVLVKTFVGDGLAADFYREVAQFVDEPTRRLVNEALADSESSAFAIEQVQQLISRDPTAAARLSLWGRRLVGEAISQSQQVAAERDALAELIIRGMGDVTGVAALIGRITDRHMKRMTEIGLSN
jgi:bacterioferritin (cytochrome b1)